MRDYSFGGRIVVFDGSLDSQFSQYPREQREHIYAFQRRYGSVRVAAAQDTTGDIVIEGLDRARPEPHVLETKRVRPNGRFRT